MSDYTIEEFCEEHGDRTGFAEWAQANCETMRDVWNTAPSKYLMWLATQPGVLTDATLDALDATSDAEWDAALDAAWDALDAARDALDVVKDALCSAKAKYLRANCKPNFAKAEGKGSK